MTKLKRTLYFAYGSNMNLPQMDVRCPDAVRIGPAVLDGYRIEFCGNGHTGVATLLPQADCQVNGVLWEISEADESRLDHYEGYPWLYGKDIIEVSSRGESIRTMVYRMNSPYCDHLAPPSKGYLQCLLAGCAQNSLSDRPVREAAMRAERTRAAQIPDKPIRHRGDER